MIVRVLRVFLIILWDSHARLAQVVGSGVSESYLYDETGQRVRQTSNGVNTFYPFAGYEQTGGAVTRHYAFGGRFVAVRSAGSLSFLYQDQLSSTIYATDAYGNPTARRGYYAFGAILLAASAGEMPTDYHFTGQREDGTGLYYYGARYYDPQIGSFLSPDTIVPDPNRLIDYNRYLYARGNPVKYNDPSGHCSTLQNGEPDMENDGYCWGLAQAVAGFGRNLPDLFNERWRTTPDQWLTDVASLPYIDSNYLQPIADQYNKEWRRQVGLPVDPVQWAEPNNPEVKLLGQDAAEAVAEDMAACRRNWPLGCSNLADDAAVAVAGGTVLVCAGVTGGTCLFVGGMISTGAGVGSSTFTTINALNGNATATDVIVSWATTATGYKYGPVGKGVVGAGITIAQRIYDWWSSQQ